MEDHANNLCRSCMKRKGRFQSIFVKYNPNEMDINLAEMIMEYASVQITLEDGLPQQICLPCAKKASELYLFKKQCETSDQLLREMLGKPPLCKVLLDEIKRTKSLEFTEDVIVKSENNADLCESSNDFDASVETIQPDETKSGMPRKLKLKKQKHECNVCRKIFKHVSFLKRHMKVHDPPENLLCDVCNKTFTRSDLLQRHKTIHGLQTQLADTKLHNGASVGVNISELPPAEEKLSELKCSACNVYFNKWKLYVQHIESGHPDLGYSCMMCYRKFQKKSHLKRHMVTHQIVKPHSCDLCDKGFSRLEQLVRHKNDHSGIKTHICHICSRGFQQISNLKDHMRTHNGEKPYLCSTCGKSFSQYGTLRRHTIGHSGVKSYICSVCEHKFATKRELDVHLTKHSEARPYICQICNHGFKTATSLTKHKRIHTFRKDENGKCAK